MKQKQIVANDKSIIDKNICQYIRRYYERCRYYVHLYFVILLGGILGLYDWGVGVFD